MYATIMYETYEGDAHGFSIYSLTISFRQTNKTDNFYIFKAIPAKFGEIRFACLFTSILN